MCSKAMAQSDASTSSHFVAVISTTENTVEVESPTNFLFNFSQNIGTVWPLPS